MIGQKMKEARLQVGLTVEAFATSLNVTNRCVFKWETGKNIPNFPRRHKICEVLNVEMEYFGWDDKPEQTTIISTYLKSEREKRKLTPKMFAEQIGLRHNMYWGYEARRWLPKLPDLIKISNAFDVSVEELITGNNGFLYDLFLPDQAYEMLAKRIVECRERAGMSRNDLAACIDTDQSVVKAYEMCEVQPTIKRIRRIADTFNCTIDEFLSMEGIQEWNFI